MKYKQDTDFIKHQIKVVFSLIYREIKIDFSFISVLCIESLS
jgi:hypothetical protein